MDFFSKIQINERPLRFGDKSELTDFNVSIYKIIDKFNVLVIKLIWNLINYIFDIDYIQHE